MKRGRQFCRTYLRTCPVIVCTVFLPYLSIAQTNNVPPRVLTLGEALDYALQHYPAVRASLEQVSGARAGVALARTQYLPLLTGVYQDSRATQNQVPGIWLPTSITPTVEGPIGASSGQSYWGSQAAALFSWEPLDFGLRPSVVGLARSAESKSNADLAVTRLQVATAVGNVFLTVVAAEQAVVATQANVDRWQTFNLSVHTLADNALRPGADASRADSQLAMTKTQLYRAQEAEQVDLAALAALMGAAGNAIRLDTGKLLDLPPADSLPTSAPAANPLAQDQMAAVRQVQAQEKIWNAQTIRGFFSRQKASGEAARCRIMARSSVTGTAWRPGEETGWRV